MCVCVYGGRGGEERERYYNKLCLYERVTVCMERDRRSGGGGREGERDCVCVHTCMCMCLCVCMYYVCVCDHELYICVYV